MFGFSEKDALGADLYNLIVPERYREKAYKGLERFIKTGTGPIVGKTLELMGLRKDGGEFPIELSISEWSTGDTWHATGVIRDITERKQAEERLKRSEQKYHNLSNQLEEANSMKELLLDVITHDLKNPAGVIRGMSDMVLLENPGDEMVKTIKESSESLLNVIDNATILSRVAIGEEIEKNEFDLAELIEKVTREFIPLLKAKGMNLENQVSEPLPLKVNPIIAEVFKNYISNAIKYSQDGKQIIIEHELSNDSVTVSVKDFGMTIPEKEYDNIFKRSVQLRKGEKQGRGLGLAIVKRITDAHGGQVWVEANTPKGNIFYLKIPKR